MLLERDAELDVLTDALDRACDGAGSLVLVEGPPGVGKSRLLEATAQIARDRGMLCLSGRGAELEQDMPFGVARQVLGPAVAGCDAQERERLLDGLAAGAGCVLGAAAAPVGGKRTDQAVLVDALYWFVYQLTQPRVDGARVEGALIAVDDAQWADAPTLRVLMRLAIGVDELPVAIVVAVRSDERKQDGLLARLRDLSSVRMLRPATLSDDAVAALVRGELGEDAAPELCRACARATGGNPFLVCELVASLRADGVAPTAQAAAGLVGMVPDSVVHSVLLRLARLPADARALAEAAAVLGPDAPLRLGAAVAALSVDDAELPADELVVAGMLRSAEPLLFAHPLIADAVAAEMSQLARARAHRCAAELLAADGEAAERVAAHLRQTAAGGDQWVVAVLREAAAEAMARGEAHAAVRLLQRAFAEPPAAGARASVLDELATAEAAGGSPAALQRLVAARESSEDPRQRARSLQAMSRLLFARGEVAAAVEAAERGRAELEPEDPLAARVLASQVANMFFMPDAWTQTERLLGELERGLGSGRLEAEPLLLAQLATRALWLREGPGRLRPLAEAVLAAKPSAGEVWQGDPSLAAALVFAGDVELAERVLERMAEHARRTGSPIYASMTAHWRATLRLRQGWVADAAADAERVLETSALGWSAETAWSASVLAQARVELCDLEGARGAIAIGQRSDATRLPHGFLLHAGGEVALAAGDPESALEAFSAAGAHLRERYSLTNPAVVPWRAGAAMASVALGHSRRAARLADAELADARATEAPHAMGIALRASAAARGGDERTALLREAVEVLAPSGAQLEHIRALCDLGAALRHARRTRAAREQLDRALKLARRLGTAASADRAYRELRLTGARPQRLAGGGQAGDLTPGERRVAELAARDHSNAQIAQRLFITPRTVEWHLTQTYRKLGIRSRAGLAGALHREADARAEAATSR